MWFTRITIFLKNIKLSDYNSLLEQGGEWTTSTSWHLLRIKNQGITQKEVPQGRSHCSIHGHCSVHSTATGHGSIAGHCSIAGHGSIAGHSTATGHGSIAGHCSIAGRSTATGRCSIHSSSSSSSRSPNWKGATLETSRTTLIISKSCCSWGIAGKTWTSIKCWIRIWATACWDVRWCCETICFSSITARGWNERIGEVSSRVTNFWAVDEDGRDIIIYASWSCRRSRRKCCNFCSVAVFAAAGRKVSGCIACRNVSCAASSVVSLSCNKGTP